MQIAADVCSNAKWSWSAYHPYSRGGYVPRTEGSMMEELGSRWGEARGGIDGAQDELTTLAEYVVEAVQTGERMAGAGFQVHIVVLEFGRGGFRFDRHFEADDLSGFVDGMETHVELLRRDHDMFCETRRKEREAG